MKQLILLTSSALIFYFLPGCSSTQQTTQTNTDSVYVFDEVIPEEEIKETTKETIKETFYMVQIGAFTTKERAEQFAEASRNKTNKKIITSFSPETGLYVVQIDETFKMKYDAEQLRNMLWTMNDFSDAWIITVNK